jgi:starch phosphorylase
LRARTLAAWLTRAQNEWPRVHIEAVEAAPAAEIKVGAQLRTRVWVHLGGLAPDEVNVELCVGRLNADGEITAMVAVPMQAVSTGENGSYLFEATTVPCCRSGLHGYTARVLPFHPDLKRSFVPGLIVWADPDARIAAVV